MVLNSSALFLPLLLFKGRFDHRLSRNHWSIFNSRAEATVIGAVSVSESLVAMVTICLAYLILKCFNDKIPEGLRRLPGPKPLPIIGNVLEVGSRPYLSLTAMSKRYGDVFQIQIGMRPVVVLSGSDTIRQALIKQGDDFAGRPDLPSFRLINDGKSLAFSTDQAGVWRARRKLAYSALRSFSTLEGTTPEYSCMLEEHICKEGEHLIKQLKTVMQADGRFDPFRHIVVSVANVICGMCFGRRYNHDDEELLSLVNLSDEFGRVDNIRDITDSLIDHCEDRKLDENSNIQMSDEKIVGIVNDLFGADTSLNGYYIPKDTCVFINQWQINHDPPVFLRSDRFLSSDGSEVNKQEGERVMVFGMGKRRCIGEVIAKNEVYLFLAIIVQKLHFHAMPGQKPDMTPEYGLTMKQNAAI
ncbi:hypothetical protein F7725_025793 [Dissostichus mawsoni]|uniref:unspecific monooxygenase n=1 Tax=Dissostichus mawsoni TaxID=36200 RepID=A0A7J5X6N6_DISMA|nr:hypothetical protein F7725_025793 [Dissostichus mawsoni]